MLSKTNWRGKLFSTHGGGGLGLEAALPPPEVEAWGLGRLPASSSDPYGRGWGGIVARLGNSSDLLELFPASNRPRRRHLFSLDDF